MISRNRASYPDAAINTVTLLQALTIASKSMQTQCHIPLNIISHVIYGNAEGIENNIPLRRCVENGASFFRYKAKVPLSQKTLIDGAILGVQSFLERSGYQFGWIASVLSSTDKTQASRYLSFLENMENSKVAKIKLIYQLVSDPDDELLRNDVSQATQKYTGIKNTTALKAQLLTYAQPQQEELLQTHRRKRKSLSS